MGLAQLDLVEEFIRNRQEYCRTYDAAFADLAERGDVVLFDTDWKDIAPYIYVLRVRDSERRNDMIEHLSRHGVATGIHFLGAHEFTFYAGSRRGDLPVTEKATQQVLTLPLHPYMDAETLARVTGAVRSFFGLS